MVDTVSGAALTAQELIPSVVGTKVSGKDFRRPDAGRGQRQGLAASTGQEQPRHDRARRRHVTFKLTSRFR